MNRNEADLILRHYTAEYAELSLKHYAFDTAENFGQLVRETSAAIQGTLTEAKVDAVLRWWRELSRRPFQHRAHAEGELNIAVNEALDNAGVSGKWILRRGEQQPVSAWWPVCVRGGAATSSTPTLTRSTHASTEWTDSDDPGQHPPRRNGSIHPPRHHHLGPTESRTMSYYEPDNTDVCEGCEDNGCGTCDMDCCDGCLIVNYEEDPDEARDRAYAYGWDD